MKCPECGKEIEKEKEYCDNCGASLDGPAVIHVTKDDLNKKPEKSEIIIQDAFIDLEGYGQSLVKNLANLIALIGAFMMYLTPFLTWAKEDSFEGKFSASLFDLAGKNGDLCLDRGILGVYAVGIILMATVLLIFSAREYIRPLQPFASKNGLRFIPLSIAILFFVLINIDKKFAEMVKDSHIEKGIAITFFVIGVVLSAISIFVDLTSREKE